MLGVVLCFGAVAIVLFMVLVARVFKVFNTAFWVIAWLVFSFWEKMIGEKITKITRKMKIPLPPFSLSVLALLICFGFLRKAATKTHDGTVTL